MGDTAWWKGPFTSSAAQGPGWQPAGPQLAAWLALGVQRERVQAGYYGLQRPLGGIRTLV